MVRCSAQGLLRTTITMLLRCSRTHRTGGNFSREVTEIFLLRDLLNHWLVKMAESGKLRRIIGKYEKVRSKLGACRLILFMSEG